MLQIRQRIKLLLLIIVLFLPNPSLVFSADLREMYESAIDYYNKAEYGQAINIYQQMIKDSPQFVPAYIGLGLALKANGADIEEVLYYYKMAVDKDPNNTQALEQLGRLYYSIGQMDKAKASFEKAIAINPNAMSVKQSLAWIYLVGKNANPSKAIKYFNEVVHSDPSPNAYFGLGIAYFSDNQRSKALD